MKQILSNYLKIESSTLNLIKSNFFLQLVTASFFLILNIYLAKNSFTDSEIADFISYRFLAVILLSFPMGYFIRSKNLKPFIIIGSIGLPLAALTLIITIKQDYQTLIRPIFFLWGIFYSLFNISVLPFIMKNVSKENRTHAITLSFATHSFGMIITGLLIFLLGAFGIKDEGDILLGICFFGFISVYYASIIVDQKSKEKKSINISVDWMKIVQATIPTLMIAIGAGLTIPFINLFFFHTFNVDSSSFALLGGFTSLLVATTSIFVPSIKNKFGLKKSIINTQLISVSALILLSTTAFFNQYSFAIFFAVFFYLVRAPLMNMAAPLTSELTMEYVGDDNHEMLSAIVSAIWSGSWFFSSKIFKILIDNSYSYSQIFYITSVLYLIGILFYYLLIKKIKN